MILNIKVAHLPCSTDHTQLHKILLIILLLMPPIRITVISTKTWNLIEIGMILNGTGFISATVWLNRVLLHMFSLDAHKKSKPSVGIELHIWIPQSSSNSLLDQVVKNFFILMPNSSISDYAQMSWPINLMQQF